MKGETTEQIARRIKEFLIENKISQRVLAESLLNDTDRLQKLHPTNTNNTTSSR